VRLAVVLALAACGSDRAPVTDAPQPIDLPADVALPPGCDAIELGDLLNDFNLSNGAPEVTGLALGATPATICGRIDADHYDATGMVVDVDAYEVTVPSRAQVLVTLAGTGADALANVAVQILDTQNSPIESATLLGTHAAVATVLAAGTYRVVVVATNAAAIAAPIDYKLQIVPDDPAARCAAVTTAAAYTEANDGPQSNRNDVVEITYDPLAFALTAVATDDPEPTGITTAADTPVRITGTSANVDAPDDFKDRDAYLVTTGTHDQLAVRVDWTGDADFDVFVFPETTATPIGRATTVGKTAPEQATFAVLPGTRYWIWVGSYDSSAGLPVSYDLTLCPTTFAP
jgi:hypothetical protein